MMKTGLTVRQSVYVDDSQVSTHVVRHHFHQLMVLYPEQLDPAAIRVFFAHLHHDVTLISEANLQRLGPVDMVIAGWPCQGHSRARAGRGLEDPRSSFLGTSSGSCNGGMPTNLPLGIHNQECTTVGRFSRQGIRRHALCLSTPW